jgi:hypothetical protein
MMPFMSRRRAQRAHSNRRAATKAVGRLVDLDGAYARKAYSKVLRDTRTGLYQDGERLRKDFDSAIQRVVEQ